MPLAVSKQNKPFQRLCLCTGSLFVAVIHESSSTVLTAGLMEANNSKKRRLSSKSDCDRRRRSAETADETAVRRSAERSLA